MALSPIVSKVWMWRIVGTAAIVAILCIAGSSIKMWSHGPHQRRMVVGRPKQEPVVLTSTFKLKPGEYVGPIKAPSETEPWRIGVVSHRRIGAQLKDTHGQLVWKSDGGPQLPFVEVPQMRPGYSFFFTSLEGEQEIEVRWKL